MSSLVHSAPTTAGTAAGYRTGFALFLIMNGLLLIRPGDLFPSLAEVGFYELAIIGCFLASFPAVLEQFTWRSLSTRPITLCILGFGLAVAISESVHKPLEEAFEIVFQYAKILIYYLLLLATVNSSNRLATLLRLLAVLISFTALLAVLQYHEIIDVPALAPLMDRDTDAVIRDEIEIRRLRGAGIFNDPNDMGQLLAVGMVLCLWGVGDGALGILRRLWAGPLALLGYSLMLTQSRGAFVALVCGLGAFLYGRFGLWRTVGLAILGLPALLIVFSGRMTEISPSATTGQQRVQIWSDGLQMFREDPIFGVGVGEYNQRAGFVAHNSFLHCFAEIGFIGGMCFLGAFLLGFWSLLRLRRNKVQILDPLLFRLHPYLLGALAAYAGGLLTLSRAYVVPTYLVLGLVAAFVPLAQASPPQPPLRSSLVTFAWLAAGGVAFLLATQVFVSVFVRWG